MMDGLALRFALAAAMALLVVGAVMAMGAGNVAKRIAGAFVALLAAALGLAVLGAPATALSIAIACMFATLAIGIVLGVRLQETYGGVEAFELNAADAANEPAGPEA